MTDVFGRQEGPRGFGWAGERPDGPKRCPRCGGWIPNDDEPGAYPGAMSRYMVPIDGELRRCIEICSACGEHEAFQQMGWAGRGAEQSGLTPPHDWPIPELHEENVRRQEERREQLAHFERMRQEHPEYATDAVMQMEDGKSLEMRSTVAPVEEADPATLEEIRRRYEQAGE